MLGDGVWTHCWPGAVLALAQTTRGTLDRPDNCPCDTRDQKLEK